MPGGGNKSLQLKADLALLGVTFIWGITFVVVQNALDSIGPYYFLGVRFLLAFLFLGAIYYRQLLKLDRTTLQAGLIIGMFLFGGYAFQTVGLQYTTAANAGFITGLSVVLVPVFSTFFTRQLPGVFAAGGVILSTTGLAFLSLGQGLRINRGDLLVFFCAICFALHIIMVGRYARHLNPPLLATIQIGAVSLAAFAMGLSMETWPGQFTRPVWIALLLTAIPATSLAFLIQNSVQRFTSATHTAIIFTMEPVFAALGAYLLAGEILTARQLTGCLLILGGMLLAELKGEPAQTEIQRTRRAEAGGH
ncbi:EamA family transporter [Desulfofundulus thermobenzoicus]|uniref:EamA family transporter n=1 Tax=Desulfofundulus thermobenzoicus TaxID=29376 RepID=A0A6N7ILG4_9FIRM|nr:DMT family transporter [Desulfofundulus thermobenzoicus]MQL50816.1 EamA family transporter [Desulfofundulus thermobenzoicus]